jgi:hypothetical protein
MRAKTDSGLISAPPRIPVRPRGMRDASCMSEGAGDTLVSIDDLSISKEARDTSGAPTLRQIRERH